MRKRAHLIFLPRIAGEVPERSDGGGGKSKAPFTSPLRLASLDTSPASGGGKDIA